MNPPRVRHGRLLGRMSALLGACAAGACAITPTLPDASEFEPTREGSLELRYFGTSTLAISDGEHAILVDGFFSRPSTRTVLLSSLGAKLIKPDEKRIGEGLDQLPDVPVGAILVAHAHHDHAMDTAHALALYPRATLLASRSAINVLRGQGLRDENGAPLLSDAVEPAKGGDVHHLGEFTITVLDATHETTWFGPGGPIRTPLATPAALRDYRAGPSFAFHIDHPDGKWLVMPSFDGHARPGTFECHRADVVLLGVGLLGRETRDEMKAYWDAVVGGSGAGTVHLIHWDNFMHPLAHDGMRSLWFDDMRRTRRHLCAFAQGDPLDAGDDVNLSLLPFIDPVPTPSVHVGTPDTRFCPDG